MDRIRRIVIIGGGIIGSAIAAFLGEHEAAEGVLIVERDPSYRRASSALSTSRLNGCSFPISPSSGVGFS